MLEDSSQGMWVATLSDIHVRDDVYTEIRITQGVDIATAAAESVKMVNRLFRLSLS
jgi:hypothetical protein